MTVHLTRVETWQAATTDEYDVLAMRAQDVGPGVTVDLDEPGKKVTITLEKDYEVI